MEVTIPWVSSYDEIRQVVRNAHVDYKFTAIVPTMGNLHAGHRALITAARKHAECVIVSIFVNPTQFGPNEDFARYPRTPEQDRKLCTEAGATAIFAPSVDVMYPKGSSTRIEVGGIADPMCGQARPGHFAGVATVVAKLFHLVPTDLAFFGLKDYQQCRVIDRMVRDLNFPIKLIFCPTVRDNDGLALSSRNSYLTAEQRSQAPVLKQALDHAEQMIKGGERSPADVIAEMTNLINQRSSGLIDYIEIRRADDLSELTQLAGSVVVALAVKFGSTRLIDNQVIDVP